MRIWEQSSACGRRKEFISASSLPRPPAVAEALVRAHAGAMSHAFSGLNRFLGIIGLKVDNRTLVVWAEEEDQDEEEVN